MDLKYLPLGVQPLTQVVILPQPDLLAHHRAETFKGSIHLALFGLTAMCAAYNFGALLLRPRKQLGVNVVLYTTLAAYETHQVYRHWAKGEEPR